MKKKNLVFLLIAFSGIFYTSFTGTIPSIELSEAIKQNRVSLEITSTGGYSGKCISLKIQNLTEEDIKLSLKRGTTFVPADDEEQTLLVPQSQSIAMGKSETHSYLVPAYCTENSDKCPSVASKFQMSFNTNPKLDDLMKHIATMGKGADDMIQPAVWCITDNQSVAGIYSEDLAMAKSMRTFLCSATGQKDTWYTTKSVAVITPERRIASSPVEVKGKIEMNNAKSVELTAVVKDESGNVKLRYPNKIKFPAGKMFFDFKLKVGGWEKGNYYVVYTCDGKEVLNQLFVI